jgi:anti-anti-sigma factor
MIVEVAGEADLYNRHQLDDAFASACFDKPSVLVVDLTEAEYFDSSAIGTLVRLGRSCDEFGGALRLVLRPGSNVERVFVVAGLKNHFRIYASCEEALPAR